MGAQYGGRLPGWFGGRVRNALVTGLLVGLLGLVGVTGPLHRLEELRGLNWLFALRGPIVPPENVAIVGLSDDTAFRLQVRCANAGSDVPDLCRSPEWSSCIVIATEILGAWPRCLYAHLVESLAQSGAALIVLDVAFAEAASKRRDLLLRELLEDGASAKLKLLDAAMARAGRVIHVERWETERVGDHELHTKVAVDSAIAAIALATAPFPLPKTGDPLHRFWAFKASMRDTPTLPVVVLQAHALPFLSDLVGLLEQAGLPEPEGLRPHLATVGRPGGLLDVMGELRRQLRTHPEVAGAAMSRLDTLPEAARGYRDTFGSLLRLYSGAHSDLINFYGPPGTLPTIAADAAFWTMSGETGEVSSVFRDKVVFVGVSTPDRTNQNDGHRTVFTSDRGVDLSGVEIAATVFANLITNNSIQNPGGSEVAALLFLFGVLASTLAAVFEGWRGAIAVLAAGAAYLLPLLWRLFSSPYPPAAFRAAGRPGASCHSGRTVPPLSAGAAPAREPRSRYELLPAGRCDGAACTGRRARHRRRASSRNNRRDGRGWVHEPLRGVIPARPTGVHELLLRGAG